MFFEQRSLTLYRMCLSGALLSLLLMTLPVKTSTFETTFSTQSAFQVGSLTFSWQYRLQSLLSKKLEGGLFRVPRVSSGALLRSTCVIEALPRTPSKNTPTERKRSQTKKHKTKPKRLRRNNTNKTITKNKKLKETKNLQRNKKGKQR